MSTIDVVSAAFTAVKTAGDIAEMNVLAFLAGGLKLIDQFAHPLCAHEKPKHGKLRRRDAGGLH